MHARTRLRAHVHTHTHKYAYTHTQISYSDFGTVSGTGLHLHELKQHKPWFDEECLGFLDQRKKAKMQWVQDPSQSNVDDLNNVRREASRHIRNKKKAYLKAKFEEHETISRIKNIRELYRGISDFKKGYQPRTNIVKDWNSDLVADYHGILAGWRNSFSQLLNVHGVNGVRQTEIHQQNH